MTTEPHVRMGLYHITQQRQDKSSPRYAHSWVTPRDLYLPGTVGFLVLKQNPRIATVYVPPPVAEYRLKVAQHMNLSL